MVDAILGIDFLKSNQCVIDFKHNSLSFHNGMHNIVGRSNGTIPPKLSVASFKTSQLNIDTASTPLNLTSLLDDYQSLFNLDNLQLPNHRLQHDLNIELNVNDDIIPWPKPRIYKLSNAENDALWNQIQDDLKKGIIEKVQCSYASPLLCKKEDKKYRFCVDYRILNQHTKSIQAVLPRIDDVINIARNAKCFSKLDLKGAYNQVRVSPNSERFTAFICKHGTYKYKVIPFGLKNAPTHFQNFANFILQDLLPLGVIVYIDDILIATINEEENLKLLNEVFKRLSAQNLILSKDKCIFFKDSIVFLGYTITADGIAMISDKVESIQQFPIPTNVKQLQSFLGACNFYIYRDFIDGYSKIASA